MIKNKVKFFKALGDETRLNIVRYLLNNKHCACEFTSMTKKDQTTISRHLKVLVEAGILKYEKKGRNIIYSIKDNEIKYSQDHQEKCHSCESRNPVPCSSLFLWRCLDSRCHGNDRTKNAPVPILRFVSLAVRFLSSQKFYLTKLIIYL